MVFGQWGARAAILFCATIFFCESGAPAFSQIYSDNLPNGHPAIQYTQGPFDDPVARLQRKIESGAVRLEYRADGLGYLPSVLEHLGVNVDSQALVFSKTSFQASKISPRNPRAIYFADDVAVGWVRGGDGIELAALDPKLGTIFYTLGAPKDGKPAIEHRDVCLQCHQGPSTLGVPGMFIGSVYPDSSGMPSRQGAIVTDHRTAFEDRWGGWYVNATSGEQRDRANSIAPNPDEPQALANEGKQNLTNLSRMFNPAGYLAPVSDIVALMTFEHQTQMIDFLTRLGWEARIAAHDGGTNSAREAQVKLDAQIKSDVNALVSYMLFSDEAPLKQPVEGVSSFQETFPQRGPRDKQGRSLRDFDLKTRLFRYPLSYLIYSPIFDALPDAVREQVYRKLYDALVEKNKTIIEIVADTKPGAPEYWRR